MRRIGALMICGKNTMMKASIHGLGSGYVVPSSAPHLILHSFRMLAAVTYATDYSFPEAAAMKASASAGPAVAAKAEVAETKEKVASVKSKSSEGVGGFFGDEEEDY